MYIRSSILMGLPIIVFGVAVMASFTLRAEYNAERKIIKKYNSAVRRDKSVLNDLSI